MSDEFSELSARTRNALINAGIKSVDQLRNFYAGRTHPHREGLSGLLRLPNMGRVSAYEAIATYSLNAPRRFNEPVSTSHLVCPCCGSALELRKLDGG